MIIFFFCMIIDLVSKLVAHPMMEFIGIPKPEKMVEINSGEFFFFFNFAVSNSVWFISIYLLFSLELL